ncbi:hypothetical protein OAA19_00850 [Rubripirellula sp.]|nr:hypothetical protein [Rubripirellula sp.]MDB4338635.1 hypothetical protein [Rubripirellula sp.]
MTAFPRVVALPDDFNQKLKFWVEQIYFHEAASCKLHTHADAVDKLLPFGVTVGLSLTASAIQDAALNRQLLATQSNSDALMSSSNTVCLKTS